MGNAGDGGPASLPARAVAAADDAAYRRSTP